MEQISHARGHHHTVALECKVKSEMLRADTLAEAVNVVDFTLDLCKYIVMELIKKVQ